MQIPRPFLARFVSALILLGLSLHGILRAQNAAVPAANESVRIERVVTNGFVHPGIGYTKENLDLARAQTIAGKEPWASYYRAMALSPDAARDVACRNESAERPGYPDADGLNNRGVMTRLGVDGRRAQTQALMYFFTGDETYRANALRILRVWSRMDPTKASYYPDGHIHTGWPLHRLLNGAEIIRYTSVNNPALRWTEDDTRRLTHNLITPTVQKVMYSNGWFMNQNNFALHGAMSAFIFTNDREGYDQRVEWFTVNKTAPNPGWDGSIKQLARLVDTDALTGKKVEPQVQLVELGRDGAHAAEDVNLFVHISMLMMAQGTKVDPVSGEPSTASNAVGPFEFLDDRILKVADYAARWILGYDTRWIPVAYDMAPDGTVRRIYPRLSDQYRGRLTTFTFWHLYFYYKYERGVDVASAAPHFHELFLKRIEDLDWLRLPKQAEEMGAALLLPPTTPGIIALERRVTALTPSVTVVREDDSVFVRVAPTTEPARLNILSAATPSKTLALRVRSNRPAHLEIQGFTQPWIIPDTGGRWIYSTYELGAYETLENIAFLRVAPSPGLVLDLAELVQDAETHLAPPRFVQPDTVLRARAYAGQPFTLNFSAPPGKDVALAYSLHAAPAGASINQSGAFTWKPTAGQHRFVVAAGDDRATAAKFVILDVAPDFDTAVAALKADYDPAIDYVRASRQRLDAALAALDALPTSADADTRHAAFAALQSAIRALEPLSPRLADGSLDYVKTSTSPDAGQNLALLADANDDTFPVFTLARDGNYTLDFGPDFKVAVDAFSIEGRLNFEERAAGTVLLGSNDGREWTRLTSGQSEMSTGIVRVEVLPTQRTRPYRFLRIQKTSSGIFEPSELRLHARRVEIGNLIESATLSSPGSIQNRIVPGDIARLEITTRGPVRKLRASIQGTTAQVKQLTASSYLAEATMLREKSAPGWITFRIDYERPDGSAADPILLTTDESRLLLGDDSTLLRNLPDLARVLDPVSGAPVAEGNRWLKILLDGDASTFTDIRATGGGSAESLTLDFGPAKRARLSRVELLARQDRNFSRIGGTVVEGSDDLKTWTALTSVATATTDWQSLPARDNRRRYRYVRVVNPGAWFCNMSELRLHGVVE
jgi:hypothetical protein